MYTIKKDLEKKLTELSENSLYKNERIIQSPQNALIEVNNKDVLNFCANNYLGLSNNQQLCDTAQAALDEWGFGLSSVRFICGTQTIHKKLEKKISEFLRMEDTILYTSCFDANGGLFETLFNHEDAIISDELNHASIIDGVRLSKAQRFRYKNSDMEDLERVLTRVNAKHKIITTDGVFSMDGYIAKLDKICALAEKYNALVHVDDSHATGFIGKNGRGSIEHCNVINKVDIVTSTLGKALGGSSGGFTSGKKEIISYLRQKSRPYLFSNSLPPVIAATSIKAIDIIEEKSELRKQLHENTHYFRTQVKKLGFKIQEGIHPIVPIMLYDSKISKKIASDLIKLGIYVISFSYPVVPKEKARIRVQISAAHTKRQLDIALNCFEKVGRSNSII